ncbi:UDP-Glycosyltransferase superfamily protein [Actinidia rufa]|uniref:UDP-Glycosyltransferase superfamily protein n=1 Tax=Actinidia rufa TaxID=165716 RepID=A0A7J0H847_9ERIC|nr:UDP-Glycosyltransferase superfamily protein [Actinidia rufa]
MTDGDDLRRKPPHIALFPSAGMGHLTPFLRLAAMLASRSCTITLITANPTISAAESTHISAFFSAYPRINRLEFETIPYSPTNPTTDDPFFLQFEAINRSVHLLRPLLSSLSPPLSAVVSDFAVAASFGPIANDLSQYPLRFFNPNHLFASILLSNARFFPKAKGLLLNTFDRFESETIDALNNGRVLSCLPPVHPIGPLEPSELEKGHPSELEKGHRLPWLDDQNVGSVVYISFGSRTAMSKDQIRELGNGLEISGCAFLWVLKISKVDTEDNEELQEVLEESFLEKTKNRGIVVKEWVKQEEILAHPAIGGFVSHCGWNSVMEVAQHGVPVLAWPQHGDQRVNAEVVERAGLGVWVRSGVGEREVSEREEIGEKVREMMSDRELRNRAKEVGEEAREGMGVEWELGEGVDGTY